MEREEFEEIPWSNLVADVDRSIDRRWYLVAVGVGVVIVAVLGFRLMQPSGQPVAAPEPTASTTSSDAATVTGPGPGSVVVAEADLRNAPQERDERLAVLRAEWFVTDYFTRDESPETARSVRSALGDTLVDVTIPHDTQGASTFVEWARAFDVAAAGGGFEVSVAYRAIRATDGGFAREPVRAVRVAVAVSDDGSTITALPESIDPP